MFLLQIGLLSYLIIAYTSAWYYLHIASIVIGIVITLKVIVDDENPMYKIIWIVFLLLIPIFGVLFYLYSRTARFKNTTRYRMNQTQMIREKELSKIIFKHDKHYIRQQQYLTFLKFPVYQNTTSVFLGNGKEKQQHLLKAIKEAETFIFMEYFIITKSNMWDEILAELIKKQKEGVEIRIIYDDLGSAMKLPFNHHRQLEKYGFKVVRFNPMSIHINFSMNYRDHRKIVVIDNKIAFTGGFNIGDEYTNKKKVFGYWNDAGIMIQGDAVWSFTVLFLENWIFSKKEKIEFEPYKLPHNIKHKTSYIPFGDIPTDKNLTAKNMYLSLINDAKESIYITAPYLILDNEIATALKLAAQSGTSVNIIVPQIPDKKLVYMVSESFIEELIVYGVRVFKFMPGFIHSKMIICDQKTAMIGTSNLDFRSLYLHLENNLWLNDEQTIKDMMKYMIETLSYSRRIKLEDIRKRNFVYRIAQAFLRGLSPLL